LPRRNLKILRWPISLRFFDDDPQRIILRLAEEAEVEKLAAVDFIAHEERA
jgi:hypothetical protein